MLKFAFKLNMEGINMQTKKRAKSVKFGKKTIEEAKKLPVKIEEEKIEEKVEKVVEKDLPDQDEIESAQEIKQKIADNISSKTEDNPEPHEVNLKEEPESTNTSDTQSDAQQEPVFGSFSESVKEPKKKSNWLFFILVVLITFVIGIIGIAGFYYFSDKGVINATPTPTIVPTIEPSPTVAEVDLSEFPIEVLNGSGISGVAAKVKTQLTDAGFTVDSVGNAKNSDFTKTIISVKKSVSEAFVNKIIDELKKNYSVEEKTETLEDSNDADVVVTIGSSTAE